MELERKVTYALQTELDRAIDRYKLSLASNSKLREDPDKWSRFIATERAKIKTVASIQQGLEAYRSSVRTMSLDERQDEKHNSARLGDNMRADGLARPDPYWHAHAIVPGTHGQGWFLRAALAEAAIGIDDSHNGCWLPCSSKYAGRAPYPSAVPHSRIHRFNYYEWLQGKFRGPMSTQQTILRLNLIRNDLLYGTYPPRVMLPKSK